jgi:hypothetical protein
MSRKILKRYTAYQRHILAEFIPEKILDMLDKEYTKAKINRMIKFYLDLEKRSHNKAK